jgi:hypothetical protein
VTVESIIISKGEEEPQIIHHSQERAAPRCSPSCCDAGVLNT